VTDITITFADGETMVFPPVAQTSILVSAEKAGKALAHNCRSGTCRTCAGRSADGKDVLLCVTPAEHGFRATVPYNRSDIVAPTLRRAKINRFEKVSRSVWEVRYRLQFPLPFLPGQYVEVMFPGMDTSRRFSMANAPFEKEQVLHVRDLPGGVMSDYLANRAKPEDAFTVRGPFGVFYLRATPRPKLFVAGGTGLAPLVSMLRSIDPDTSAIPLAIVAGFAGPEDAYALEELHDIATRLSLEIIVTAMTPSGDWNGGLGNPVEALERVETIVFDAGSEAYLCGPPAMVEAARARLLERGLVRSNIFNEEFVHAKA
jgi:NAD(P)H-flavin reductase